MSQELRRVKRLEKLRAHHQKCEKRMDAAQTLLLMKANIEHSTGEHIKELSPDEPKDCSPSSPHQTLFSAGNHLPSPSSPTEDESELSSHSGSDEEYHPPAAASSSSSTEDELLTNELASQRVPEKHECDSSSKETEIIGAKSNKDSKQSGARSKKGTEQSHRLGKKLKEKMPEITIKMSNNKGGARAWDKAHYCVYCKKANLKIARHLERKHGAEKDVAHAFSFPSCSKERKTLLEALRNKGDWQHNLRVLEEGSGEIVPWRRPTKTVDVKNYLPCQHCYAMFVRTELWRHEKTCRERKDQRDKRKRVRVQKSSSQLIPITESSEGVQKIIHSMQQDHVTSHIRDDKMICTYGDALFAKKGREQSQHRYIAQKLRELGRFVLAAKEIDKSIKGLCNICDPAQFHLAIKAARKVSNYNPDSSEYGKPSTAVKIGFSLKGATEAWIGRCLICCDTLNETKAKKFKELLDSSWSNYVSANAHSTIEQRKWGKEDNIPLTEDVETLQNYLKKMEDEAKAELTVHVTTTAYKKLSESLLAQIIVFNKKREGEASRLTLETYKRVDTGPLNKDIYETLSPVEQQLSHRLTRLVTRGKRGRKVPILLLERTKASLDFLIEKRGQAGILEENPYVFARPGTTTNIRGCDCLRKFAEESKAKHPELLRSTKLRKHVATLCQLLDLDNQELEQVARFMGHDIRVHCDYYRQTDKTFQVAKIGKLLFAMEHGAESLKGKSLKTLDTVISGRGPVSRTTRSLRGNDADTHLEVHDDEEMTWEPIRRPDDKQQEEITTKKRYEKDEDKQEPDTTAAIKHADDNNDYDGDDDDDDDDENRDKKKLSMNTKRAFKRPKKTAVKRKRDSDDCDEEDGEDRHRTATKSSVKNQKKTASQRPCSDDAVDVPVSKPAKRPWTETEKNAVRRQMGKFMALRKVPGKNDCRMCIEKESASLGARTWRDVKYFVYNEIIKIKRKFQNR
ncbi:uncharacterized protein LOC129411297 isoform X2 [Boleophthalmus pectinirostris]|uniref:uncharacterized protein LOC129411297 isoform X2 n=1 Tax=Boleophthalmus pectinirostris TaxID=150288 RepID=UPI00242BCD78|nr:uncharacterized protein LOC129411297 isoform X2 [Boleophthalmus pectinirostris]